jgi:hypothetical protein
VPDVSGGQKVVLILGTMALIGWFGLMFLAILFPNGVTP